MKSVLMASGLNLKLRPHMNKGYLLQETRKNDLTDLTLILSVLGLHSRVVSALL